MRTSISRDPARAPWLRPMLAMFGVVLVVAVTGCGTPSGSLRPSPSLVDLDFTPLPTVVPTGTPKITPKPTLASWPVGWDVAFCTAFADTTVAHELAIDIDRALQEDARDDAAGLANDLAQTAPLAGDEVGRIRDWEPSAQVKLDLTALIELDKQVAAAYQTYFRDGTRQLLRDARQLRKEVGRSIPAINEGLLTLAGLGLSCPGVNLELETL